MAQEARAAVDVTNGETGAGASPTTAASTPATGTGTGCPGSPALDIRAYSSSNSIMNALSPPPPRTPESGSSSAAAAVVGSPSAGMVDRRQLFQGVLDSI